MASGDDASISRDIRTLWSAGSICGMTDAQLLDRFARRGDEVAFSALVGRHGPPVWRVVRGILGDRHAAEDAFQATFLVLARKAGAIARPESLGPWLHGVASRVARKAWTQAARRRRYERHAAEQLSARAEEAVRARSDMGTGLNDEVARLPEAYRIPVVLCYLEGMTHQRAATHIGVSESTVRGRLARARGLLRRRLASRDEIAPSVCLAGPFPPVPEKLAGLTTRAAVGFASGRGATSAVVAKLAEGILQAMFISKLKVAVILAALPIAFATGGPMVISAKTESPADSDPHHSKGHGEWAAAPAVLARTRGDAETSTPRLKVEVSASPGRLLMGEQVAFDIAVRNPGSGPARNVIVRARLSNGLRLGNNHVVEQTIAQIQPGDRIELEPLIVDTVAGGQQTCTIEARSAEVNTVVEDQRVIENIEVTKPELTVKLAGEDNRYTGQTIDYKLAVNNPGTAPARKVKVTIAMPKQGGKMISSVPDRATFDKVSRRLLWTVDQVEPGQSVEMTFAYLTSTPGLYRASAEASSGELRSTDTMSTDVSGIAVLDLQVSQTSKLIDIGKTNKYDITIKNVGSEEALRLQLRGNLTKGKLKLLQHFHLEKGQLLYKLETGDFVYPEIDRLAVGQSITLSLEAQAIAGGPAGCRVFLDQAVNGGIEAEAEEVILTSIREDDKSKRVPR